MDRLRMADARPELRELCAAEYPRLVGALRLSCGNDGHLAEDLAQEALARLCRDWQRVQRGTSPRAWLYRVAFNLAHSHWRRLAVRRRVESQIVVQGEAPDHADGVAARNDVRKALMALSVRERTVIVLRQFLEVPVAEAAVVLGVSEQAIRSLNHRALRRLRTVLSDMPAGKGGPS